MTFVCSITEFYILTDILLEYRDEKDDLIHPVYLFQDRPSVLHYLWFFQFHYKSAVSLEGYFTAC